MPKKTKNTPPPSQQPYKKYILRLTGKEVSDIPIEGLNVRVENYTLYRGNDRVLGFDRSLKYELIEQK